MTTYRRLRPIHRAGSAERLGLGGLADGDRRDFSLYCLALSILTDALEESPREVRRSLLPVRRRGRLTLAATLVGRWVKELTGIVAQARLGQAEGGDRVVVEINKLDVKQWSVENLEI